MPSKFLYTLKLAQKSNTIKQTDNLPEDKSIYKKAWLSLMSRAAAGIVVEPEWSRYSTFKTWAEDHYFEHGFSLSSLLKTPETDAVLTNSALFIPKDIWSFIKPNRSAENYNFRGVLIFTGRNRHRAVGYFKRDTYQIGTFDTAEEAHFAWLWWKIKCGYKLLDELDPRCWQVKEAFVAYLERMENHLRLHKEFKR